MDNITSPGLLFYDCILFLKHKRVWYHWDNSFINITIYFYNLHLFELKHFCVFLQSVLFYVYLVFISVLLIF